MNTGLKRYFQVLHTLALSALALFAVPSFAAGLMTPASGGLPALEIKEYHVTVSIEDGYAITTIDQTFHNPHGQELEAMYSFPVPHKATVGEFTYWIDGKPITGEVVEKNEARQIYQREKSAGNEVALTEQDAYRTFDSTVYPVRPQADVRIRLKYIQTSHADLGIGRYVYPLEEGGVDEQRLSFWSYNDKVNEAFSFNLKMRSSYPLEEFRLPHHPQAIVSQLSANEWQVSFGNSNGTEEDVTGNAKQQLPAHTLDKDIVVYWRHQANLPGSVDMVTYKAPGKDHGTFMLTVTPGDDLPPITTGRDWVFVLDLSGSMQGKYTSLVDGVTQSLQKFNANDRFRIILFNDRARELTNGYVPITAENIDRYGKALSQSNPGGGTNLYAGVEMGFKALDADRPSAVLLVTDGVANVGVTEKKQFLKLLERTDVRLFSFVMGNSANKPLLEGMVKVSNGFAMNISNSDDIVGRISQTAAKMSHEAYRDIDLQIKGRGIKVHDVTPAHIGSLYNGQQLIVFGRYRGDGIAELTVEGKVSAGSRRYSSPLAFPKANTLNPELERLWAFASIEAIQERIEYLGADSESKQAIIDLARQYGLVTDYTSLVVMREEQFKQYGIDRSNAQRVAAEHAAQTQRAGQPVSSTRQDAQRPAFTNTRPNTGGGALGPWSLIVLLPLLFIRKRRQ